MGILKIVVCGAMGRMGQRISALCLADKDIELVGAVEFKGHSGVGTGDPKVSDDLEKIIDSCDVIIDFSSPKATLEHVSSALKHKKPIVIGTTGFKEDEIKEIKKVSEKIPIVLSPNMSIGVNVLFKITEEVAKAVPGYDKEIVELHHNKKKDAPSGTAMKLYNIITSALNLEGKKAGVFGREGMVGERKKDEIGVMSVRAGDIVGEHTVYFAGTGERIELTHRVHSRDTFASGAIYAAKRVVKKENGIYDMQDILGFRTK